MKQIKTIFTQICLFGLILSCTSKAEYASILDRAEQQNLAYDSITNIDSIKLAVEHFDNHGSANERVRAHYLLGCAFRDAGEAPLALESYHNAADCADTISANCDYRQLMVVHSQMANLFYEQLLPYECKAELDIMYKYALLAKDTLSAFKAIELKANAYDLLNESDSVIAIRNYASALYKQYGYTHEAAICLGPIIDILIEKGNGNEAYRCIQRYQAESGAFIDGEIINRKAIFLYSKGLYYLSTNKLDSAEVSFRKLLLPERTSNHREAGYRGLYLLYNRIGQKDSLTRYANLWYDMNRQNYVQTTIDNIQQMQSLYNYTRSQQLAQLMSDKAHRHQLMLYIVVFSTILILLLIGVAWWKRQENLNQLKAQYEDGKEKLREAKEDLEIMESSLNENNAEHLLLLEKKNSEIIDYQKQIKEFESRLNVNSVSVTKRELMETPIYQRIQVILTQPKLQMTKREWAQLRRMIDQKIPSFYSEMNSHKGKLLQQDYDICILVRLYLTPKEIVFLTGNSYSAVSMKRTRLLKKIFGIEGSPEKFDELVQEII